MSYREQALDCRDRLSALLGRIHHNGARMEVKRAATLLHLLTSEIGDLELAFRKLQKDYAKAVNQVGIHYELNELRSDYNDMVRKYNDRCEAHAKTFQELDGLKQMHRKLVETYNELWDENQELKGQPNTFGHWTYEERR